jgi:hypothetical protein
MRNLLEETKGVLEGNGLTFEDVEWIGSESHGYIDIDTFIKFADIEYDAGFGGQKIAQDLVIVGKNWWLERGEYDGSEWWAYKTLPKKPESKIDISQLSVSGGWGGWRSLKDINTNQAD